MKFYLKIFLILYVSLFLISKAQSNFEGQAPEGFDDYFTAIAIKLNIKHNEFGTEFKKYLRELCITYSNALDYCSISRLRKRYDFKTSEIKELYDKKVLNELKDASSKYESSNPNIKLALDILNYISNGNKEKRSILALSDEKCIFFIPGILWGRWQFSLINLENVIPSTVKLNYDITFDTTEYTMEGDKNIVANSLVHTNHYLILKELNLQYYWEKPENRFNIILTNAANAKRAQKAMELLFSKACKGSNPSDF